MLPPHLFSISTSPFVPVSATVSFAGSLRRWSLAEPGVPPSPTAAEKVPGSLGTAGGPCSTAGLPGAQVVLVLKTKVVFSKVFSTSESCSLWLNMVVLKEEYF